MPKHRNWEAHYWHWAHFSCSASAQREARATLRFPIYELDLPLGRHAFLVLAASERWNQLR